MWSLVWELLALLILQEVKKWIGTFVSSISFISHPTKWSIVLSAELEYQGHCWK